MSDRYEAVVVAAPKAALLRMLETLPARLLERGVAADPFAPFTLELFAVGRGRFVLFAWRAGANRPDAWEAVDDLADEISLDFGTAVAVHYDNMVGVRNATLSQEGEPIQYFGEADEIWAPIGSNGEPRTTGPRYPGNSAPRGIECARIRDAIDAALETAGFHRWLTAQTLHEVAYRDQPLWQRPGVGRRRQPRAESRLRKTRSRGNRKDT
jgi:hypothetical protein